MNGSSSSMQPLATFRAMNTRPKVIKMLSTVKIAMNCMEAAVTLRSLLIAMLPADMLNFLKVWQV